MSVTIKVKRGPCGRCGVMFPRDEMHSMNIKFFSPEDVESKVRVRLCGLCRAALEAEMRKLEWCNSSMVEEEIPVM